MLHWILFAAALQITESASSLCEGRENVEIYVVEDMVDGRQSEAPFRVIEVIRGRDVDVLELEQTVYSSGFLTRPNELSKGTVRLVFVEDGRIKRRDVCTLKTQGNPGADIVRFPSPPGTGKQEWREDAFELGVQFARAYVRFEREPTVELLIEMLTSDELAVARAGMYSLPRVVVENQRDEWEAIGAAVLDHILRQLPLEEGRRLYLLEHPGDITSTLLRVASHWQGESEGALEWEERLVELILHVEAGQGPHRVVSSVACGWLQRLGYVETCLTGVRRSRERFLQREDRERLMRKVGMETERARPERRED